MFKRFKKQWGDFGDVKCHEDRLNQPFGVKKPQKIFVNSMSDLFHENVPFKFVDKVMNTIESNPQHTFQILTKRPERMRDFFKEHHRAHKNLWLGVSVENQETSDERIPILLDIPASVRFLSCEPLLGRISFTFENSFISPRNHDGEQIDNEIIYALKGKKELWNSNLEFKIPVDIIRYPKIDWVIVGGESGRNARPMHPDWVRSIRDQCLDFGVPFFFKQWGEWVACNDKEYEEATGVKKFLNQYSRSTFASLNINIPKSNLLTFVEPFNSKDVKHLLYESNLEIPKIALKVGNKSSGSLLDGQEWKEFPRDKFLQYVSR